jgi:hypothetical protein
LSAAAAADGPDGPDGRAIGSSDVVDGGGGSDCNRAVPSTADTRSADSDVSEALIKRDAKDRHHHHHHHHQQQQREQQQTTQFDVKIGDGMDIAIHGENGKNKVTDLVVSGLIPGQTYHKCGKGGSFM